MLVLLREAKRGIKIEFRLYGEIRCRLSILSATEEEEGLGLPSENLQGGGDVNRIPSKPLSSKTKQTKNV